MRTLKIFTILALLLLSYSSYSYSQVAEGTYPILQLGHHHSDKNFEYSEDPPANSSIVFKEKNVFIFIGSYRVDVITYDDKDADYSNEMTEVKAYSHLDKKNKKAFIQLLQKGMYMFWLERGNGGADIFLFTTPAYGK